MKTNLANWLSALCAILLIVLLVLQTKQKGRLEALQQEHQAFATATEQHQQEVSNAVSKLTEQVAAVGTNMESRLVQDEQQANEKLGATMNIVQQNTAVMHRALGKVIPVELPESVTNELAALEARIADENSWPEDSTNTDAMLAQLHTLVTNIPPWAEEDLLPRLNAVRWAAQSLQVLQANANAQGEDLDATADAYANQLSIQPDGASTNIAAILTSRQQDATNGYASFRFENTTNEVTTNLNLVVMDDDLAAAEWQNLAEWTNNQAQGQKVIELRRQLHARLLEDETSKFIESVDAGLAQATNEPSLTIRQISFGKLLDGVVSQRQILLETPDADASLSRSLTDLAGRIENAIETDNKTEVAAQDKKLREYQRWALESINSFNVQFTNACSRTRPMFSGDLNTGAVVGGSVGGGFGAAVGAIAQKINPNVSNPDYPAIEKAMTNYLTPISVGLLDTAVARLFNDAFEKGWGKLDGTNEKYLQTEVAEQEAVVEKKKP